MNRSLPSSVCRPIQLENGCALGTSDQWDQGCYCKILTAAGVVGCAIFNIEVAAEFDEAYAIAKGTPDKPLIDPEDLLEARIVGVSPRAEAYGVAVGMSGREATELFLRVSETA